MQNSQDKILVDTSVWVESYRNPEAVLAKKLKKLLTEGRVITTGIIIAEILQGAKTVTDFDDLQKHLVTLPVLPEGPEEWISAGAKSHIARQEGFIVPISDCLIAAVAEKNNCKIFTGDKHFHHLKNVQFFK